MTLPRLTANPTIEQAKAYLIFLARFIGRGFHIDTPIAEYVQVESDRPSFSAPEAALMQRDMNTACEVVGDPYAVVMESGWPNDEWSMDEDFTTALASAFGGEAFQSGGNIWIVIVRRDNLPMIVIGEESIAHYANDQTFESGKSLHSLSY